MPYRCEKSADCEGGWHCGVRGVCYDPNQDTAQPCRPDAGTDEGSDCADGWRCGLEGTCHQLDVAAPYRCASDLDCEAEWRCGVDHVCVDVASQALIPSAWTASVSKVSPLTPVAPDHFVHSQASSSISIPYAWSVGSAVSFIVSSTSNNGAPSRQSTVDVVAPGNVSSLAVLTTSVFASGAFGVIAFNGAEDGGYTLISSQLSNAQLVQPLWYENEVVAFTSNAIGVAASGTDPITQVSTLPAGVVINDVAHVERNSGTYRDLYAATSRGLYWAQRVSGSEYSLADGGTSPLAEYRPVGLPSLPSSCNQPVSVERLRQGDSAATVIAMTSSDHALWRWSNVYPTHAVGSPCDSAPNAALDFGPCLPCGTNETLVDFGSTTDLQTEAICRDTSGAVHRYTRDRVVDAGECGFKPAPISDLAAAGVTFAPSTVAADGLNAVGVPLSCLAPGCGSVFWTPPADRIAGDSSAMIAMSPFDPATLANGNDERGGWLSPSIGLINDSLQVFVSGGIENRPDLLVSGNRFAGTITSIGLRVTKLASIENSSQTPDPYIVARLRSSADLVPTANPIGGIRGTSDVSHGSVVKDGAGTEWLVVGVGDRIWASEGADRLGGDAGIVDMDVKVVPLPFGRLQSLALGAPENPGLLMDGYAVSSQRLFRLTVPAAQLWLSDEIRLPDAVPLKAWRQKGRGRVGTTDGRVFGLPIPVALSEDRIEGGVALDYAEVCGHSVALTPTGIYRLVATDGPVGKWESVPLTLPNLPSLGQTFVAPLHVSRHDGYDELLVMNKLGLVLAVKVTCTN